MLFAFPKEQLSLCATHAYRWWTTAWCLVTGRSSSQTPQQQATPPRCRPCSPPSWKTLHPRWVKQRPFTQGQQSKDPLPKVSKTKTLHPRSAKQRPFTQGQQNKDPSPKVSKTKTLHPRSAKHPSPKVSKTKTPKLCFFSRPLDAKKSTHTWLIMCVCAQGERNKNLKPVFLQQAPKCKGVDKHLTDVICVNYKRSRSYSWDPKI